MLFAKAQSSLPTVDTKINISKLIAYEKDGRVFIEWSTDGNNKTNYWEVLMGNAFPLSPSFWALIPLNQANNMNIKKR